LADDMSGDTESGRWVRVQPELDGYPMCPWCKHGIYPGQETGELEASGLNLHRGGTHMQDCYQMARDFGELERLREKQSRGA